MSYPHRIITLLNYNCSHSHHSLHQDDEKDQNNKPGRILQRRRLPCTVRACHINRGTVYLDLGNHSLSHWQPDHFGRIQQYCNGRRNNTSDFHSEPDTVQMCVD